MNGFGEFRPLDPAIMTQVLIAPMLMLMMWKHSVGPCDQADLDPMAFLNAFLEMALHGVLPRPAGVDAGVATVVSLVPCVATAVALRIGPRLQPLLREMKNNLRNKRYA